MSIAKKKSSSTGLTFLSNKPIDVPDRLFLCIPGLGSPGSDYLHLLQGLAERCPRNLYVAPDLPGSGDSHASLCPDPTFSAFVKLLGRLCDELETPSNGMVLIGHSMGCRLALESFSQFPDSVSAVILLDGSWHGPNAQVTDLERLPPRDVQLQYILNGLDTMFGRNTPEGFKEEHRRMFQEQDLGYLARLTMENRRWDAGRMVEALRQIRTVNESHHQTRLLLVQAMDGAGGPRRALKRGDETAWMKLVRENTGSAYNGLVIEDSGHWPHVDHTEQVARAILQLLTV